MALVDRREGRNFGYGRQLSYSGPQALKDLFTGGHLPRLKRVPIAGKRSCIGVGQRTVLVTTMRARSIDGRCKTTQLTSCAELFIAAPTLAVQTRAAD